MRKFIVICRDQRFGPMPAMTPEQAVNIGYQAFKHQYLNLDISEVTVEEYFGNPNAS